jgi:endonuclease-8
VERVQAVGKQMFLETEGDLWLRVHLGLYGAWDFSGEILVDPTIASANGRMGQTNSAAPIWTIETPILDDAGRTRWRPSAPRARPGCTCACPRPRRGSSDEGAEWPPPVVGRCACAC